jgi:hypothetical protein
VASHSAQPAATGSPTRRQLREAAARAASAPAGAVPAEADPAIPARRSPSNPLARWGTRAGVLLTIAAVTVAVPLSQEAARSDDTFTDAEADATLPTTVEAAAAARPAPAAPTASSPRRTSATSGTAARSCAPTPRRRSPS